MFNTRSITAKNYSVTSAHTRKLRSSLTALTLLPFILMGCDLLPKDEDEKPAIAETSPDTIPSGNGNRSIAASDQGATPMLERIAVLGLLNKRTGKSRTIRINPDKSIRFGNVVVKVQACERTAPWETYPDIGAFTQLFVKERPPGTNESERWRKVFSGWLHKNNPAQNVVEHGLYDVWVKDCIMLFPGESSSPVDSLSSFKKEQQERAEDNNESSAVQSPTTGAPSEESTNVAEPAPQPATEPEPIVDEAEEVIEEEIIEPEEEISDLDDLIDSLPETDEE